MNDVEVMFFNYGVISTIAFVIVAYLLGMTVYGVMKIADRYSVEKEKSL